MNKIILIGNLTADPELRYTASGIPVANFTVAVNRPFNNQQGQKETDFIRVVAWRKLAEICAKHLTKGRKAAIEGRLQIRKYSSDGAQKLIAEVIASEVEFLGSSGGSNDSSNQSADGGELPYDDINF